MNRKPNKFLAPIVIAGVTIGFLASAYKFVFAKPEQLKSEHINETEKNKDQNLEQAIANQESSPEK